MPLFFPHFLANLVVVCGLTLEREEFLPQRTNCQKFRELSGKQTCSDTGRRARNPVDDSERAQSRHDTE